MLGRFGREFGLTHVAGFRVSYSLVSVYPVGVTAGIVAYDVPTRPFYTMARRIHAWPFLLPWVAGHALRLIPRDAIYMLGVV